MSRNRCPRSCLQMLPMTMTFEVKMCTSTPKQDSHSDYREITPDVSCVDITGSQLDVTQSDVISLDLTSLLGNTLHDQQNTEEDGGHTAPEVTSLCYLNKTLTNRLQQEVQAKLDMEVSAESTRKEELLAKIGDYLSKNSKALKKTKIKKRLVKRFSMSSKNLVQSLFAQKTTNGKKKHTKRGQSVAPNLDHQYVRASVGAGCVLTSGLSFFDATSYMKGGNKCTWC